MLNRDISPRMPRSAFSSPPPLHRPRRFATSLVPPANCHNFSTMSYPRYADVASRLWNFGSGIEGRFIWRVLFHLLYNFSSRSSRSSTRSRQCPAKKDLGKLTAQFSIRRITMGSSQQARRNNKGGKTRRAEIVYFSLAKRRKIKGKQETTTRDSGNQAGLRPGMDFPGGERTLDIERSASRLASSDRRSGTRYTTPVTNRDLSMACNVHARSHARYLLTTLTRIFLGFYPSTSGVSLTGILKKFYREREG